MKKIKLLFVWMCYSIVMQAQHDHPPIINPNISPYHDADDALNGFAYRSLLQQPAWQHFMQKHPLWGARFNRYNRLPHRAAGNPIALPGSYSSAEAAALAFIQHELNEFNIPVHELVLMRSHNDGKFIHVDFKQVHHQKEVLFSRFSVRFTQKMEVVLFGADVYSNISAASTQITSTAAVTVAEQAIVSPILRSEIKSEIKLFPFPEDGIYAFRPAYEVIVHTQDEATLPGMYKTYVDANDGKILYRTNLVNQFDVTAKALAFPTHLYNPADTMALPHMLININGTNYYTDITGVANLSVQGPYNITMSMSGLYAKVVTGQNGNTTATQSMSNIASGATIYFDTLSPNASIRHTSAYIHTNIIHDFMKSRLPGFTSMDNPLTVRVDRTDGNCNAFYNGTAINFYTTDATCNALSQVNDVVYHEYGHGITNVFWNDFGLSFDNGAMGEGYADIWGISIIKKPIIGTGFYVNQPSSFIRRYDVNPKVYPRDIVREVHADGEIIAGAWWDVAFNLSSSMPLNDAIDTMSVLFANTHYGLANGPDGQEGQVYFDILIDALEYDDDDNNITNGTPHFIEIVQAFAKHGIYLLSTTSVTNQSPIYVNGNQNISIQADVVADFPAFLQSVSMIYRPKGINSADTVVLTNTGNIYSNNSITLQNGEIYEYIFALQDISGGIGGFAPSSSDFSIISMQRNVPYYLMAGYTLMQKQDFESPLNSNWTVGNYSTDNATAGQWIIAKPIASRTTTGDTVQTGNDHTSGNGKCAVTGNASNVSASVGTADVDGGRTSLVSDAFDLTGYAKPVISYWRWYSNSQGSGARKDRWRVFVSYSTNGTSWSNWISAERTMQPDVSWRQAIYEPNLNYGNYWKLLFMATDSAQIGTSGALLEAAVDDIEIYDFTNAPAGTQDVHTLQLLVFPNPTTDYITIYANETGDAQCTLYNQLGQQMYQQQFIMKQQYQLPVNFLHSGVYYLRLQINGKESRQKIIIK